MQVVLVSSHQKSLYLRCDLACPPYDLPMILDNKLTMFAAAAEQLSTSIQMTSVSTDGFTMSPTIRSANRPDKEGLG